jgi:hypothetical protein
MAPEEAKGVPIMTPTKLAKIAREIEAKEG